MGLVAGVKQCYFWRHSLHDAPELVEIEVPPVGPLEYGTHRAFPAGVEDRLASLGDNDAEPVHPTHVVHTIHTHHYGEGKPPSLRGDTWTFGGMPSAAVTFLGSRAPASCADSSHSTGPRDDSYVFRKGQWYLRPRTRSESPSRTSFEPGFANFERIRKGLLRDNSKPSSCGTSVGCAVYKLHEGGIAADGCIGALVRFM